MKTTLTSLVLIFCAISTFGQDKNFDLSKYKTPFYKRHELTTEFNLGGNNTSYTLDEYQDTGTTNSIGHSSSYLSSNVYLNYNFVLNSRKKIIDFHSRINPRYNYDSQKIGTNQTKTTESHFNIYINGYESYYLKEDRLFLKLAPTFEASPSNFVTKDSSGKNKRKTNSINASLGLGAGLGRIEPVSDLWQSYYILKKLESQGLLNRQLTDNDIFEFAQTATQLKNKRFFDFRLRKIAELETLDSLTHKQGLISDNSIGYITTLNDYWNFASIPDRYAGHEMTLMVTPKYLHNTYQNNGNNKDKSHRTMLSPSISFRSYKPLNLFWDRVIKVNLADDYVLDQEPGGEPSSLISTSALLGFYYYPNFRTIAKIEFNYNGREWTKFENDELTKYWRNDYYLQSNLSYYISPQLQISGNLSCDYYDKYVTSNETLNDHLSFSYSLSLSYAIF